VADPGGSRPAGWRARSVAAFTFLVASCAALLAATAALTGDRIEHNRNRQFLDLVQALIGDAPPDTITWEGNVAYLCNGRALLRGSAQGYAGAVRWLAAADVTGAAPTLTGVRITAHQETPGIADFLDRPERGWLALMRGREAGAVAAIEAVSGATITSRALRGAIAAGLDDPDLAVGCDP
jgi:Na+-translocating ferredoxin:NAD+ oxidoreductase RnfG subunit